MIEYKNGVELIEPKNTVYKRGSRLSAGREYSDNIYTFDIEVSSLFKINNVWQSFDYSIYDYSEIPKASCVYIGMFGINDNIYYFRNFMLFAEILKKLSCFYERKIIYVHNLGYEFQFLRMIFSEYTIENMLASAPHKPIAFVVKELNIEFRCSYRLTNLSLEKSAEKYTNIKKLVGALDYEKARHPFTPLTDIELSYCEYDIKTLYEIIRHFRTEYGHIYNIPYTQTGEVRRDLRNRLDYFYFEKQKEQIPPYDIYLYLMQAFQGGITHANMVHAGRVLTGVDSADEASAYPTMILTKKFPYGKWSEYDIQDYEHMQDFKAFLLHIRLHNVKSKLFNHYISSYKCIQRAGAYVDNGRIIKADMIELIITDCDYEMIKKSYSFDKIEYLKILGANKKYLDRRILQYVLDLYKQKTELKGVAGQEDFYMKAKQRVNSIFGCACTNPLNQDTYYKNNEWGRYCADEVKETFIKNKLEELKQSTNYFNYAVGVWITAYNRMTLWSRFLEYTTVEDGRQVMNDKLICYYDTDSIKSIRKLDFTEYNKRIVEECRASAEANGLDFADFAPLDRKGRPHPIGIFEQEETAAEFITLGAKKYCARYEDGLHLTVSGVRKKAVKQLNDDIRNFTKSTIFDYDHAKKNIHYYTEQKPFTFEDYTGNKYTCCDTYGIVLQPTTYTLGITSEYEKVLQEYGGAFYE